MKRIDIKSYDRDIRLSSVEALRMVSPSAVSSGPNGEAEPLNKKLVMAKRQSVARAAFTIVELLTVMSIIVILIGLLLPALNRVRIYAKEVRQRAQFHSIDAALELFNNEFDGYPPSSAKDPKGADYCGAMKLCEAMMGQDMLGFHTNSVYRQDGWDKDQADGGIDLYPQSPLPDNLKARKGPFLPSESANAYSMRDTYGPDVGAALDPCSFVLCDVYTRPKPGAKKTGMPVLYYKANTANNLHYYPGPPPIGELPLYGDDKGNIYNYFDNHELVWLGKPWVAGSSESPTKKHSLVDPGRFYKNTKSHKITTAIRPYRADSYILLSAGFDGEYGTADDIFNFEWEYTSE